MGKVKTTKQAALEFKEKYGDLSEHELNELAKKSIGAKFAAAREKSEAARAQEEARYNLSYGELIKGVASAKKRVAELESKPEELLKLRRAQLEAEYDHDEKYDLPRYSVKEVWVSEQLVKYMGKSDGAYYKAKEALLEAKRELAIFIAKKEEREEELADVIEAERYRTRRADLLSADPEALRALGIEPPVTGTPTSTSEGSDSGSDRNYMDGTVNEDALLASFMEARGYGKGE